MEEKVGNSVNHEAVSDERTEIFHHMQNINIIINTKPLSSNRLSKNLQKMKVNRLLDALTVHVSFVYTAECLYTCRW